MMKKLKADLKKILLQWDKPALLVLGSFALTAILMNLQFNLFESNLYDLRMSMGPQYRPDPRIVLVTIDDATIKALNDIAPISLDRHALFLETLEKLKPEGVGYLVDLNRAAESNPDFVRNEWGERFVRAAQRLEAEGIPVVVGTPFDIMGEVLPPFPLSSLNHSIALIHKDGNVFAEDKVTRRALTFLYDKPVFHMDFARRLGLISKDHIPRGDFYVPEVDAHYLFFRYHGSTVSNPGAKSKARDLPYRTYSFLDILNGKVTASEIEHKIVLVGTMTREDSGDYAFTPYSKSPYTSSKLVVHANILDSVLHDDGIVLAPDWVNWLLTFAVTCFVIWWVLSSTPLYGLLATITLVIAYMTFAQLFFFGIPGLGGVWIRESQPLVGIFLGYYLIVPYRLIREYRKRWDYQRKNEVLIQVEELKTNFLSLVTHDLKTPVARIQGLAEVLLKKSSERLIDRDKETVYSIIRATEELNRFISSVLELTKIESNKLKLNLESKDINQLIERAADGFRPNARARGIKIVQNLEPLFPVKFDVSLISKVLNNLIDNAIKYSPPNSEITIESREIDNSIEISVRDQGIGLSREERENIFTKFYRAKNDTTAKIPGTGLGLYLTKFFVEAHHGRVEVTSEIGGGSTFKIILPISQPQENPAPEKSMGLTQKSIGLTKRLMSRQKKENAHV